MLCVCGTGNNGGDGYAAARILETAGYQVFVGETEPSKTEDGAKNRAYFQAAGRITTLTEENLDSFFDRECPVVIDALFGIGLHRAPSGLYRRIIEKINSKKTCVVSVDIPSGVFADTGAAECAVAADYTVTFTAPKPGHLLYPGRAHTGELIVAPIAPARDIPVTTSLHHVNAYRLPDRNPDSHKGNYGKLAIFAGSDGMAGAAILSLKAALAGGAGITWLFGVGAVCDAAQTAVPSALCYRLSREDHIGSFDPALLTGYTALAAGPGLGQNEDTRAAAAYLASLDTPKVLDADALNLLCGAPFAFGKNTVITPHPGEFSRLTGLSVREITQSPLEHARAFAKRHAIVVLLKGSSTLVSDGEQDYIVTAGSPGMAKGGSGDVLTGFVGALLAQGFSPLEAAYGGAYLCGKAGELAAAQKTEYAATPEDTLFFLPTAMKSACKGEASIDKEKS